MNIYVEENILVLKFEKKIDYTIAANYDKLSVASKNDKFQIINLDFSLTSFITLPGAMYLLLLVSIIVLVKKKNSLHVESRITNYSEDVILSILNFGLISMLKIYGNLSNIEERVNLLSIKRREYWLTSIKSSQQIFSNLYLPISVIPEKRDVYYESAISTYYNNFNDYFNKLIRQKGITNFSVSESENAKNNFIKAVNESTKNVWDHSESWGIASIQSTKNNRTTFCLFDFGIGFIKSYIKRKGSYDRNINTDREVLTWLFQEGNTSNHESNHGHGLAIIAAFTDITKGLLLISTDNYLIRYNEVEGLKITTKEYFPGTQIMLNF